MNAAMKHPVFVLSTGRCGTLALQRFLGRSERLEAFHRYRGRGSAYRNDMGFQLEQNFAYYRVLRSPQPDDRARRYIVDSLQRARLPLIRRLERRGLGFVELNHSFAAFGPLLAAGYPDARFVHLVRHPRSVISSFMRKFDPPPMALPGYFGTSRSLRGQWILRHGRAEQVARWAPGPVKRFVAEHRYDPHLRPYEQVGDRFREVETLSPFEKTAWYWNAVNELILELTGELPEGRTHRVRFEDLFDPEGRRAQEEFLSFVGVPDLGADEMEAFFSRKVNEREGQRSFPGASEWGPDMEERLAHYCGGIMDRLGYVGAVADQGSEP